MLEVHHIFKTYEGKPLLNDISFSVDTGETICLLGASGSGKSTLLRIIAGLEDAGLRALFRLMALTSLRLRLICGTSAWSFRTMHFFLTSMSTRMLPSD